MAQSSEQAFYFIDQIELLHGDIEHGDWLLSFKGHSLTGMRQWRGEFIDVPVMGYSHLDKATNDYLRVGDTPVFKLLKYATGEIIDITGNVSSWESNGIFEGKSFNYSQKDSIRKTKIKSY